MTNKLRCFIFVCVFAIFLLLMGCSDGATKAEIFVAVEKEHPTIIQCMQTNNYDDCKKISIVKEITQYDDYVDFYCGGSGMGGQTSYRGFYYFENDELEYIQVCLGELIDGNGGNMFIPCGNGYLWQEKGGDNTFYFEKIANHIYYYEQEF